VNPYIHGSGRQTFDEVVTIIDFFSPANKTNQFASQRSYLAKTATKCLLAAGTHYVESISCGRGTRSPMADVKTRASTWFR